MGELIKTRDHVLSVDESWPRDADGELLIGDLPLSLAVTIAGGSPCYLYDRRQVVDRIRDLRARLSPRIHIHYAIKANPMPALVGMIAGLADGLDVASGGELSIALDSGMTPSRISFAGPGKTEGELVRAHAAGILLNVESLREARFLEDLGRRTGRPARVAVRCNLPFELKASGMKMAGGPKPFGIDESDLPAMMAILGEGGACFEGFHLYAGSQNLKADAICEAQNKSYDQALAWARLASCPPRSINLGGGFGIRYAAHDRPLNVSRVIDNLNLLAGRLAQDLPDAHLVIELGRYLVGEAGLYVSRVVDRKRSCNQTFLVTDGGMHQHLAASGNFGQVIRKNYPVTVNAAIDREKELVNVVGPLCTPLDILADQAELSMADVGDLFVVFQSGAYGRSASPQGFLGHAMVKEFLV